MQFLPSEAAEEEEAVADAGSMALTHDSRPSPRHSTTESRAVTSPLSWEAEARDDRLACQHEGSEKRGEAQSHSKDDCPQSTTHALPCPVITTPSPHLD
jgi:hypothetical protein